MVEPRTAVGTKITVLLELDIFIISIKVLYALTMVLDFNIVKKIYWKGIKYCSGILFHTITG